MISLLKGVCLENFHDHAFSAFFAKTYTFSCTVFEVKRIY